MDKKPGVPKVIFAKTAADRAALFVAHNSEVRAGKKSSSDVSKSRINKALSEANTKYPIFRKS